MTEPMRTPELTFFAHQRRADSGPYPEHANDTEFAAILSIAMGLTPFSLQLLCLDLLPRITGLSLLL